MSDRFARGLLDTSVVLDLDRIPTTALPDEIAISAITLAELAAGPHATDIPTERARRQEYLQRIEAEFATLPADAAVARAFGLIFQANRAAGRRARNRSFDLLIAATALAHGLPLYTRNPADFAALARLITIVAIP